MKSDIIQIDNHGKGFSTAVNEAQKVAETENLSHTNTLHLQLLTEEMLSMLKSVAGDTNASFWIENEGSTFNLQLTTKAALDSLRRKELIESSTSKKNEAAVGFLGKLRDLFEKAMLTESDSQLCDLSKEELDDLAGREFYGVDWDGYERSVLHKVADNVKIGIRGQEVRMTVIKDFAK